MPRHDFDLVRPGSVVYITDYDDLLPQTEAVVAKTYRDIGVISVAVRLDLVPIHNRDKFFHRDGYVPLILKPGEWTLKREGGIFL